MSYRDDRDALLARNEALQRELEEKQRELENKKRELDATERELHAAKRTSEVQTARDEKVPEMINPTEEAQKAREKKFVWWMAALFIALVVLSMWFLRQLPRR